MIRHSVAVKADRGGGTVWSRRDLEDAGLLLQPANIGDDLRDVFFAHTRHFRHVPEFPMMRPYAHLSGPVERDVRMMVGFVNLIEKWRALGICLCDESVTLRDMNLDELFD